MAQLCDPRFGVCNLISGFGYHLIRPLKHVFGVFTICTTRCGFVNSVFGFAARKVSRHQLYKHVNAHVYLGVWRITLNSVQAVVGIHMIMSINRFACTTFVFPDLREVQIGSCESRYHVIQALEAHIHVYTYFVYGESGLWVVVVLVCWATNYITRNVVLVLFALIAITWSAHRM